MRKLILPALVCTALAVVLAPVGRADSDPASDVLYFQDVFLPYTAPSADVAKRLYADVAAANKAGFRIKIAVIALQQDMGGIPSLYNQPDVYARFLGTELKLFYTARLLVVMPAGIGVYNNGKPVGAEKAVLAGIKIASPSPDDLTTAADMAVLRLRHALGNAGKASAAPTVSALPSTGTKGKTAKLRYTVYDAHAKTREIVRVYGPAYLLFATIRTRFASAKPKRTSTVAWNVPADLSTTKLQFCVLAQDPSGNQSKTSCAPLHIA